MLRGMSKRQITSEAKTLDPELAPLEASFERGDFAGLNEQLGRLPEATSKSGRAARLQAATSLDGAHIGVLSLCVLGLIAITLLYFR